MSYFYSNAESVQLCIDDKLIGCVDSYKDVARWDILEYQSTNLNDTCNITSDALTAVPDTSLVMCMNVLENTTYDSSEAVCDRIGDYLNCVRYVSQRFNKETQYVIFITGSRDVDRFNVVAQYLHFFPFF